MDPIECLVRPMPPVARVAERRSERLIEELLTVQGWDLRPPPQGDVLAKQEYMDYPPLKEALRRAGKAGAGGAGIPEFVIADRASGESLMVIEAKARATDIGAALRDVMVYGTALVEAGLPTLAVAIAGTDDAKFVVRVLKWLGTKWQNITYEGQPIAWVPNREQVEILRGTKLTELRPAVPSIEVLHARADEINALLREAGLKDDFRPAAIGAIMLALWKSGGAIRRDKRFILSDINQACSQAFWDAEKPDLAKSLRVDEANSKLSIRAARICEILERLNITTLTAEHDYLGALYEEFFRYTGGNTIGQYFTPRHITKFMAELCEIGRDDVVLDPACGTGGFLIAAMAQMQRASKLSRQQIVKIVKKQLVGLEDEPVTAALCMANMILRGDGSSGVIRADCFDDKKFPRDIATAVLMNPPFPHRKTDAPPEKFVERALEGLQKNGCMAVIVPRSLLAKKDKRKWRTGLLTRHRLDAVIVLPDELFLPYASSCTAVLLMTKGARHTSDHRVFFARIENDGYRLRKGVRAPRDGEQVTAALRAHRTKSVTPGFSGLAPLDDAVGWDPGYYISPRPLSDAEVSAEVGALIRSRSAFVVAHAPELATFAAALEAKELEATDYRAMRDAPAPELASTTTVGGYFDVFYGQKALHSKEHLGPGHALIISSSGVENGAYGFFDFSDLIAPPFVTVPSTGSIGRAHVQEWPCGVTDDCLILLPKRGVAHEFLYVAAAVLRNERWRFSYGMKMTPARIAGYPLPTDDALLEEIRSYLEAAQRIEEMALSDAEDASDAYIAKQRLEDLLRGEPLITGAVLEERLRRCQS